jgi:hypothetical protein
VLLTAIRTKGVRVSVAARLAGVSPIAVAEWIRRGEGRDSARPNAPIYRKFAEDVATAKAEYESYCMEQVTAQMPRDYGAAKFWLQANVPEVYGEKAMTALPDSPSVAGPLITGGNIIVLSPEAVARMGLGFVQQKRLNDGSGASASDLDDLVVGAEDDLRG